MPISNFRGAVLDVGFGDTALAPLTIPNHGFSGEDTGNKNRFTFFSFDIVATSPLTGLTFSTSTTEDTLELDNIKVTAAAVPEVSGAASLGLLLLLGLGGTVVRRRTALGV